MTSCLKIPDDRTLNKFPKSKRVLAVIGDECHGLWVVRSLGMKGLCVLSVCSSAQGRASHSRYSVGSWALDASPYDPRFLDSIEELAREYAVGSIMTISEANHLAFIENRDRFEPEIHVFSPPNDAFKKTIDKNYMRKLCMSGRIPIARGMVLKELLESNLDLRFPLILRTRQKHGENADRNAPWKIEYAKSAEELHRVVDSIGHIQDNVIVDEYHPGCALNMNVLMHKGRAFFGAAFMGEIDYPIAGGVTVQRVSCQFDAPYKNAVQLLSAIEYEGNAGVDFRYNRRSGEYIFTEINPRFEGGTCTLIRAGFNVPFLLWQSHFEPENMEAPKFRSGVRSRVFKGCLAWLKQILVGDTSREPDVKHPGKMRAVLSFLWHCGPWTLDDTFWWRDPAPFVFERLRMLRSIFRL